MKKRTVFLALACLVAGSCATSLSERVWLKESYSEEYLKSTTKPIAQQTLTVSKMTYDQVWDICERTLIRLGFGFYKADKTDGEMRVKGTVKPGTQPGSATETLTSTAEKMSVLISKAEGKITIQVACLFAHLPGEIKELQPNEIVMANKEVGRVIRRLKKELG